MDQQREVCPKLVDALHLPHTAQAMLGGYSQLTLSTHVSHPELWRENQLDAEVVDKRVLARYIISSHFGFLIFKQIDPSGCTGEPSRYAKKRRRKSSLERVAEGGGEESFA